MTAMTDREKIERVLLDYESGGLVQMDIELVMRCLDDELLGIGIGEQGFVTSKDDVRRVFQTGLKHDTKTRHSLSFENLQILVHPEGFANLCAKVIVKARRGTNASTVSTSEFLQFLTLVRRGEDWKICGLHASAPVVTEESVEAYPLKFAEKTLQSLREKLGEEAYQAEEQYRQAILADAIAFYVVNYTSDVFEKCQLNSDLCVEVEAGSPYERYIVEKSAQFLPDGDLERYLETFSLAHTHAAFEAGVGQLQCEYRFRCPDGSLLWMVTIVRLFTDIVTGERKGIMYVKDIDEQKRRELEMISKADRDGMTGALNKQAFMRLASEMLAAGAPDAAFVMLDVDNFKTINDTLGHPAGDRVLVAITGILQEVFGPQAAVGRLGGDEFGVFVRQAQLSKALHAKLAATLDQIRRIPTREGAAVSCSIGVASCTAGDEIHGAYQRADQALYQAKLNGKNCYAFGE